MEEEAMQVKEIYSRKSRSIAKDRQKDTTPMDYQ